VKPERESNQSRVAGALARSPERARRRAAVSSTGNRGRELRPSNPARVPSDA
jgi:hypothetical protein